MEVTIQSFEWGSEKRATRPLAGVGKKWITLREGHLRLRYSRDSGLQGNAYSKFTMHPWRIVPADLERVNTLADANGGTWKPDRMGGK